MKYQTIIRFKPDTDEERIESILDHAKQVAEITRIDKWKKNMLEFSIKRI